jgi:hypothetical protein
MEVERTRKEEAVELENEISKLLQTEKLIEANLNIFKGNLKKTQFTLREIDCSFKGSNLYQQLGKAFLLIEPERLKLELKNSIKKQEEDIKLKEDQKQDYERRRE